MEARAVGAGGILWDPSGQTRKTYAVKLVCKSNNKVEAL